MAESEYDHWSLFNRFIMAGQMLDAADAAGGSLDGPPRRPAAMLPRVKPGWIAGHSLQCPGSG